ncbi:MAG: nucleotidyl transferase AbiEii/AbiGii toxin family protein [Anaerolineales bacterium]
MILRTELEEVARQWAIRLEIVEKDFAISWILAGLAQHPRIGPEWIFKGGTCLKKCYLETYRFSEDLDFSLATGGSLDVDDLENWVREACEEATAQSGLELPAELVEFKRYQNKRGGLSAKGKIGYSGPLGIPTTPKVRIDLTGDELIARAPILREVHHPYSDRPLPPARIHCYPIEEIVAEKTIALSDRGLPRDLYDVVRLYRFEGIRLQHSAIVEVIGQKCSHHGVELPSLELVRRPARLAELESEWSNMLGHQLPALPVISDQLAVLEEYFKWLGGEPIIELAPVPEAQVADSTWAPPPYMSMASEWGLMVPLEIVRFAGANRLCIELHYLAKEGMRGVREVEPYSFRMSQQGNLLFYGRNTRRTRISCYRADRIFDARPLPKPFNPWWRVEF